MGRERGNGEWSKEWRSDIGNKEWECTKPLRNVDHLTLDVPFSRTDAFKNSFYVRICHLWNDLPLGIRESNTLSIFREILIAFYYDKFNVDFL